LEINKMIFATLFNMKNVHLTKDVGLIPYGMHQYFEYDAYCISYNNGPYPAINKECKGMKMWFVRKITGCFDIDAILFLIKNARKIDILNVYHIRLVSTAKIFVYKLFNPKGKVYWKMDGCSRAYENSNKLKRGIYYRAMKKCSLLSSEVEASRKKLTMNWGGGILLCAYSQSVLSRLDYAISNI